MRFFALLASAAFAGLAIAQQPKIGFTSVPANVQTGSSYTIQWGGGDDDLVRVDARIVERTVANMPQPVTIALRKGDLDSIQTVQILTTDARNGSYTWTPLSSLIDGEDYTLQITQGLDSINYSGEFSLTGGVNPLSASISSILASASSAIASANATISSPAPVTSLAGATASPTASGLGNSTNIPRNTTFSSQTMGATATRTTGTTSTSIETAAASSSSGSSGSSGTNGAEPITARYASPMALFCAIFAAVAYAI